MAFCDKCGNELSSESLFCNQCGNKLDKKDEIKPNKVEESEITPKIEHKPTNAIAGSSHKDINNITNKEMNDSLKWQDQQDKKNTDNQKFFNSK